MTGTIDHLDSWVNRIKSETRRLNMDNISRTNAYQNYYKSVPEIQWAFLASMVSRNAGWNMTDLKAEPFASIISKKTKQRLFSTYERANWLIFSDVYPQLLLYQLSKKMKMPLFHFLPRFEVSRFMEQEWLTFWYDGDQTRLMKALIINEQNVIQGPVIKQPYYKKKVFMRLPYLAQDMFYMSAVLLPMTSGEVYGANVHDFSNVTKRITLGKQLANILFHKDLYMGFWKFATLVEHTGSRHDYERYFREKIPKTPIFRTVYPVISHQDNVRKEWYRSRGSIKQKWWEQEEVRLNHDVSHSYYAKKHLLYAFSNMKATLK